MQVCGQYLQRTKAIKTVSSLKDLAPMPSCGHVVALRSHAHIFLSSDDSDVLASESGKEKKMEGERGLIVADKQYGARAAEEIPCCCRGSAINIVVFRSLCILDF